MQAHLGAHVFKRSCLEVGIAHPGFEGSKGMFDGVSSCGHAFGLLIDSILDRIQYRLMFPTTDTAIYTGSTLRFQCALRTSRRPVAFDGFPVLLSAKPIESPFAGRTFILIGFWMVNKVALSEKTFCLVAGSFAFRQINFDIGIVAGFYLFATVVTAISDNG